MIETVIVQLDQVDNLDLNSLNYDDLYTIINSDGTIDIGWKYKSFPFKSYNKYTSEIKNKHFISVYSGQIKHYLTENVKNVIIVKIPSLNVEALWAKVYKRESWQKIITYSEGGLNVTNSYTLENFKSMLIKLKNEKEIIYNI